MCFGYILYMFRWRQQYVASNQLRDNQFFSIVDSHIPWRCFFALTMCAVIRDTPKWGFGDARFVQQHNISWVGGWCVCFRTQSTAQTALETRQTSYIKHSQSIVGGLIVKYAQVFCIWKVFWRVSCIVSLIL